MTEKKEGAQEINNFSSLKKWIKKNVFSLSFILLVVSVIIAWSWLNKGKGKENFLLEEKNDKIFIVGLTDKNDLENIKIGGELKWTPYGAASNLYQYSLQTNDHFWWKKFSAHGYRTISDIKPTEIRKKGLIIEALENTTILEPENDKLKLFLPKSRDLLLPEGNWFSNRLVDLLANILVFICFIICLDLLFQTNILSSFLSTTRKFSKRENWEETNIPSVGFKDVKGLEEAKEELEEIILYSRNPEDFRKKGVEISKGILLVGPPGNGKTLLAKALAKECSWPFIFRSASEFEEALVGLGARRIREVFDQAENLAKINGGSIIFIDEIDSIGQKRNNYQHNRQTLNQLLTKMDGFLPRGNVIVIAATNSFETLDQALIRPGRFDRHIYIHPPNLKARKEIIKLYSKGKMFKKDVDFDEIASMTKGMSGAQLANMIKEASILSLRYKEELISQDILFESFDRVLMGPSLKSRILSPENNKIVAYHEAGHIVAAIAISPELLFVRKVTIIPRQNAGGYTWISLKNKEDDFLVNKEEMLAQIMSFLGGRVSEEIIFGNNYVTTGNYSDFKIISELINDLILTYNMSSLGIVVTKDSPLFGKGSLNELSESAKQKFEKERESIIEKCQEKVRKALKEKINILHLLAKALLEKKSLNKEEIYDIFNNPNHETSLLN